MKPHFSPLDLNNAWKSLNEAYGKMSQTDWSGNAKAISDEAWTCLRSDEGTLYDNDMIEVVARSIVFWTTDQKFYAINRLWTASLNRPSDYVMQNRLCSIIYAIMPGMDKTRLEKELIGVREMDCKASYGEHMARLIRYITLNH